MDSRAKAIKYNMITGWIYELFALISGLILPRLILTTFGSDANGLTSSISQYLSFSVLLRAGLGGVTRAALYKPLANKDFKTVSAIMAATRSYMRKVAFIILGYIGIIAIAYPLIVKSEYSWEFMFTMVLIIGSSVFVENFWGIQAKILLQADQKYHIQTIASLASYVAAFGISVLFIKLGFSLMAVKIGAAATTCISPIFLNFYVKKRYKLDKTVLPDNSYIKQRWDAFAHQMATVLNDNVPIISMSFFVNLKEISVYTVYKTIVANMKKLIEAFVTGVNSLFGDMLAKKEYDTLKQTFNFVEWGFFAVCTVLYSVTAIMLVPFVRIYTDSVNDVNYIRPIFALLITAVAFMRCVRMPYQMLTEAAGHFKPTRNGAILEVIINVCASVSLMFFLGITGILLGGLISATIRTLQYAIYAFRHILKIPLIRLLRSFGVYFSMFGLSITLIEFYTFPDDLNYLTWAIYSTVVLLVVLVLVVTVSFITNRKELIKFVRKFFKKFKKGIAS